VERLRKDVPAAARQVAAEQGAPEPAALLERLGLIDLDTRATPLVELLFARFWQLWRDAGLLTTPAPDRTPVVQVEGKLEATGNADPGGRVLLVVRKNEMSDAQATAEAQLLAAVFGRSTVRVSTRKPDVAKGIASGRIVAGTSNEAAVVIEVLAPP
jgi:hypothetical protein